MSPTRLVLAAALAAAACSSEGVPDDKLQGLVHPTRTTPAPIDVDKAAQQHGELVRAARLPHRQVGAALGPHIFKGTTRFEVREGAQVVEKLEVTTRLQQDASGGLHCLRENSADYGAEMIFTGGTVYVRPRYSKFHRRPPSDEDEPLRFCDDTFAELGDHLELVAAALEVDDEGPVDLAGRRGRKIELRVAPSPRPPARETAPERAWRQTVAVSELAGNLVLDQETGVPLAGELRATLGFTRDGKSFDMKLEVTLTAEAIGAVATIAAPPADQTVATFEHNREAEEREELLHGIAPPARKPPTPETVPTGKGGDKGGDKGVAKP
jgi:hypothetical protein